jgi:hypothetical protein
MLTGKSQVLSKDKAQSRNPTVFCTAKHERRADAKAAYIMNKLIRLRDAVRHSSGMLIAFRRSFGSLIYYKPATLWCFVNKALSGLRVSGDPLDRWQVFFAFDIPLAIRRIANAVRTTLRVAGCLDDLVVMASVPHPIPSRTRT